MSIVIVGSYWDEDKLVYICNVKGVIHHVTNLSEFADSLFSYAQDISVDLDPSCEVDDDGSVVLTEDELTELISEVDNVQI